MKNKIFFSVIILVISLGCASDKNEIKPSEVNLSEDQTSSSGEETVDLIENEFPQEWKLVKMSSMLANSATTGENMHYQESYHLQFENTFTKTREKENIILEASGTFKRIKNENGEEYLKLSFFNENKIIENCNGSKEEYLRIISEKIIRGSANACDHPTKEFEKVKNKTAKK